MPARVSLPSMPGDPSLRSLAALCCVGEESFFHRVLLALVGSNQKCEQMCEQMCEQVCERAMAVLQQSPLWAQGRRDRHPCLAMVRCTQPTKRLAEHLQALVRHPKLSTLLRPNVDDSSLSSPQQAHPPQQPHQPQPNATRDAENLKR
jgi:hypothetical protein